MRRRAYRSNAGPATRATRPRGQPDERLATHAIVRALLSDRDVHLEVAGDFPAMRGHEGVAADAAGGDLSRSPSDRPMPPTRGLASSLFESPLFQKLTLFTIYSESVPSLGGRR